MNFIFGVGPRAGQALISHPDVNVISFTGSTTTGYHIKKATSHLSVKLSLEVWREKIPVVLLIEK